MCPYQQFPCIAFPVHIVLDSKYAIHSGVSAIAALALLLQAGLEHHMGLLFCVCNLSQVFKMLAQCIRCLYKPDAFRLKYIHINLRKHQTETTYSYCGG